MRTPIRVLMITSSWPTPGQPRTTHFIKRQADFLGAAGVDVDVVHFRAAKRPWNYAMGWARVRERLRTGSYDVVHAQFGQSGLLALPKRLPLIVTLRGSDILGIVGKDGRHTLLGRFAQAITRFVARKADHVVIVSEHMRAYLPADVGATVLASGLDLELFRPMPMAEARRRLGFGDHERLVLFAANPQVARKRHDLARRAVEAMDPAFGARLVVAWGVPHADMPYYMNACDAMVFTSMQEGSPNVVKEALACNLPVVSVAIGDVEERFRGVSGCEIAADERPETIAAALERVLRRGERATSRPAVAALDETLQTARLIEIYKSAMAAPARPMLWQAAPAASEG